MGRFLSVFVLPALLMTAALENWSLMSMADLLAFLYIQYTAPRNGFQLHRKSLVLWFLLIFSSLIIFSEAIFQILLEIEGSQCSVAETKWAKLIGLLRVHSLRFPSAVYFLMIQALIAFVSLIELYESRFQITWWKDSSWWHLYLSVVNLGLHPRAFCCLCLPAVQIIVGIGFPSWISLPYFICSSIGLVDWSLTSNFIGLFRCWRYLLFYAGLNILLLYVYQLPLEYSETGFWIANFIGLFKISPKSGWPEICSGVSLGLFYLMLSWIQSDLAEMDFIMSKKGSNLTEQLIPRKNIFILWESRSGANHTNVLFQESVFETFSINFFTYGFPISLLALSFWSFHFTSLCAFGLLAYVGYILYAFPSMYHLHRLNGSLLIFILFWAASTYIFNVAYTFFNKELLKDMRIWETIGLWHYPVPGFYLLAQYGLGVLVAIGNLVNNYVFLYLSNEDHHHRNKDSAIEDTEETKILIVATIAWGLRKSSRAIVLALIFINAMNSGLIHAAYMIFFVIFLLRHNVGRKLQQYLILLCEVHFALLYIIQLDLVRKALDEKGLIVIEVLSQLGLLDQTGSSDFSKIVVLASCCAINNHGSAMLFSMSAILQTNPPIGFSILRAGLIRSVLVSVCTLGHGECSENNSFHELKISSYLRATGQKFLSAYRSCGTYIALLTILLTVYQVRPNYVSFGYLFFLLFWMIGRQLIGKTRRHLWLPLKLYAVTMFILSYSISVFPIFQSWLSKLVDLDSAFGYDREASELINILESLAIIVVMQLYSYERRQNNDVFVKSDDQEIGAHSFTKQILIWHIEKILLIATFYASLSSISMFGFLYLLILVFCSTQAKASHILSKILIVYSGFLVMLEYLYQLWGDKVEMFPGQKNYYMSLLLGLRLYKHGFLGVEAGLRGKILVIVACIIQYNVNRWSEMISCEDSAEACDQTCGLFGSTKEATKTSINVTKKMRTSIDSSHLLKKQVGGSHTWPLTDSRLSQGQGLLFSEDNNKRKYFYNYFWESARESNKWNRKRIIFLRKERLDKQKRTLQIYMKFLIENMFALFGLEINMIALLLASFSVLNSISMLYVGSLAACILLPRNLLQKVWPVFLFIFASVLTFEYLAIWSNLTSSKQKSSSEAEVACHDCWRVSDSHFNFCKNCWLGIIVDDPQMLVSYFAVFMTACFKRRADHISSLLSSQTYQELIFQYKNASVLGDLSFETKGFWTILDYLRLQCYCNLLNLVLMLILITGTLEYDILHLGYLGFALIFFRMRLEIIKSKNKIFKFLRMYNFILIVLSLAYQSPFIGQSNDGKCKTKDYIIEVIGFYKYDYGFRITSRSAVVETVIFMLVSLQSYMFSTQEYDYVSKYLEAEQIGAIGRQQEKRAAWKTAELQHIRESEEQKRLRNLQVEKIKSEMHNQQVQLQNLSPEKGGTTSSEREGIRRRKTTSLDSYRADVIAGHEENHINRKSLNSSSNMISTTDLDETLLNEGIVTDSGPESTKHSRESPHELTTMREDDSYDELVDRGKANKTKLRVKENPIMSAVHLIGDGVFHVKSLGHLAVNNLIDLLNIEHEEEDSSGYTSDDDIYYEIENQNTGNEHLDHVSPIQSGCDQTTSDAAYQQIGVIIRHVWSRMLSNNEVVCYSCFVLIFLWNFSLLSMVYLAALFLYALCAHTGPSYMFWVIMLMYTELCILLQYLYQIIIQHCGQTIHMSFLVELGFPDNKIKTSFVMSNLPLFLVYLFTLLQTSLTTGEDEWGTVTFRSHKQPNQCEEDIKRCYCEKTIMAIIFPLRNAIVLLSKRLLRYWKSLTEGVETPPYYFQISMEIDSWPEDGVQPARIESGINKLLEVLYDRGWKKNNSNHVNLASKVGVQSIEQSSEKASTALAVFEVLYASSAAECSSLDWYSSLTPAADVANEIREAKSVGIHEEIGFPYPIISVIGGGKRQIDLYAYIFCADLSVFFLVAIFYQSVMKNNSEFLEVYQLEDQFPKEFVFILMVLFFLIVLDRIIYLCSFATGKVIFYLFNLILFTYSVTKYAWCMEPSHKTAGKLAIRAIYLTKAVSLALQAIQMRFGLPHKSTLYRQFLTSTVLKINFLGFRIYRALPFLYELRCVLDWSCTTTSLTMYDWLKLEDIHSSLFLVQCDVDLNRASHKKGEKQTKMTKFCNGICLFFVLICVIWAPMLMYSSGNPTNIANPIKDASVRIDIKTVSGRLPLYETTLCEKLSWDEVDKETVLDPYDYLSAYNDYDIQLICCQSDASRSWDIPPVVQDRFMKSLTQSMDITFYWKFMRDRPKGKEVVNYELILQKEDLPDSSKVIQVLNGTMNNFTIQNVYPRYFRLTGSGDVRSLEQMVDLVSGHLVLNRGNPEWWSFYDIGELVASGCGELTGPMAVIISEETPQGIIGETLSKFSIWGLYITFVLAVGRFIRLQCSDLRMRIPFENLPSCDRLLAICEDIYAARAEGELEVEENLYWTLVKIYRSPHMLLEYTKPD